ncbi:MAG: hypothetical protein GWO02_21835 [Gammaproteobacteria bacterium]|nr:hypothetical protein [Gammaproteobacteria bacterium]
MSTPAGIRHDWSTPVVQEFGTVAFARALGHLGGLMTRAVCLARRQGRCPGSDQCHDCPWAEGRTRARR